MYKIELLTRLFTSNLPGDVLSSAHFVMKKFNKIYTVLSQILSPSISHFLVFSNEGIFIQLDELDEMDKFTHAWIRIHLQSHPRTDNTLV